MSVSAVVPAKGFARAKSRLSRVLDAPSRAALAREMLAHVLGTLRASNAIDTIVVVTDGEDVEELALAFGAHCVRDEGEPPLRLAVDVGLDATEGDVLVVMADLPRLTPRDVRTLVAAIAQADVVVAPDASGHGTSALALSSAGRMRTAFGSGESFAEHLARAKAAGLTTRIVESDGLAFDVDTPEDLAELRGVSVPTSLSWEVGSGTARRA